MAEVKKKSVRNSPRVASQLSASQRHATLRSAALRDSTQGNDDVPSDLSGIIDTIQLATKFPVGPNKTVSKGFWEKLRMKGQGPPFLKIGARVFYVESEVARWLASRRMENTSQYFSKRSRGKRAAAAA